MTILVLNCGSSSIKYEVFDETEAEDPDRPTGEELDLLRSTASGLVEGIGEAPGRITTEVGHGPGARTEQVEQSVADHHIGLRAVTDHLAGGGLLQNLRAIGHRVVHGGESLTEPAVIDDDVIATLEEISPLAPLHNPPILESIQVARTLHPDLPHVAVFDTAFHSDLPASAYRYAVPEEWYGSHRVRRYGFHGTSHDYVSRRAAQALGRPRSELAMITLHLGNGASACAIDGGRSVDTSMGLSPLEGLVMGTRSGDLDPAVVFHMVRAGLTVVEVEQSLNRAAGLKGLGGDNDMRRIKAAAKAGDKAARLAVEVTTHRLRKYLGAYLAVLGGLDAVVFTGGIGEHDASLRQATIEPLGHLGMSLDLAANDTADATGGPVRIGSGPVEIFVVATDEERMIAAETIRALARRSDERRGKRLSDSPLF